MCSPHKLWPKHKNEVTITKTHAKIIDKMTINKKEISKCRVKCNVQRYIQYIYSRAKSDGSYVIMFGLWFGIKKVKMFAEWVLMPWTKLEGSEGQV